MSRILTLHNYLVQQSIYHLRSTPDILYIIGQTCLGSGGQLGLSYRIVLLWIRSPSILLPFPIFHVRYNRVDCQSPHVIRIEIEISWRESMKVFIISWRKGNGGEKKKIGEVTECVEKDWQMGDKLFGIHLAELIPRLNPAKLAAPPCYN